VEKKVQSTNKLQDISHQRDSVTMLASKEIMKFKSYQNQANLFVKEYLLADPLIPYTSIIGGIFACKMVCCIVLCWHSIFCSIFSKREFKVTIIFYLLFRISYYLTYMSKIFYFGRSMIWLSFFALLILRAIPVSLKSNELSGTTGEWIFSFSKKSLLLFLMK
jgi:hypothetical protein